MYIVCKTLYTNVENASSLIIIIIVLVEMGKVQDHINRGKNWREFVEVNLLDIEIHLHTNEYK